MTILLFWLCCCTSFFSQYFDILVILWLGLCHFFFWYSVIINKTKMQYKKSYYIFIHVFIYWVFTFMFRQKKTTVSVCFSMNKHDFLQVQWSVQHFFMGGHGPFCPPRRFASVSSLKPSEKRDFTTDFNRYWMAGVAPCLWGGRIHAWGIFMLILSKNKLRVTELDTSGCFNFMDVCYFFQT